MLTILCVSRGESYSWPFVDEMQDLAGELGAEFVLFDGAGAGAIERVLDRAIDDCAEGYVLRLDDDERCSDPMRAWLAAGAYLDRDHWSFPRAHLYPDATHYVRTFPLWPDVQTRLSVKAKAGGRRALHQGSPFGPGALAPVAIEHHKFLVRSELERSLLLERYDRMQAGAGSGFRVFSLPEEFALDVEPYSSSVRA